MNAKRTRVATALTAVLFGALTIGAPATAFAGEEHWEAAAKWTSTNQKTTKVFTGKGATADAAQKDADIQCENFKNSKGGMCDTNGTPHKVSSYSPGSGDEGYESGGYHNAHHGFRHEMPGTHDNDRDPYVDGPSYRDQPSFEYHPGRDSDEGYSGALATPPGN